MNPDFRVNMNGSVWTFHPITDEAIKFILYLGIESWQWLGPVFGLNSIVAENLIERIEREGLTFEIQESLVKFN